MQNLNLHQLRTSSLFSASSIISEAWPMLLPNLEARAAKGSTPNEAALENYIYVEQFRV